MALPRTPAYKLAAAKTKYKAATQQRNQDTKNFKYLKPAMQAQQDQRNAPFFAAYSAANPGAVAANAPGVLPQNAGAAPPRAAPAPAAAPPNGDISSPDPRDSTFSAGLAALLGQVQAQRQAVAGEDATDQQSYNENFSRLAAQRGQTLEGTKVSSNRQGLLYSGILGKRQGEVNANFDAQNDSNRTALTGRQAARQAQLQQIGNLTADASSPYGYTATGGAGMDFFGLLREAADRRVAQMPDDPLAPTTTPDAGPTPPVPLPAQSGNPTVKPKAVAKPKAKPLFKQTGGVSQGLGGIRFKRAGSVTKGL